MGWNALTVDEVLEVRHSIKRRQTGFREDQGLSPFNMTVVLVSVDPP